jgi:hypothetical protein
VVVVRRLAGHVGVPARRQVESLEDVQVGEQVECAEDGGPTDAQATIARFIDQVSCGEVALSLLDESRYGTAGLGEAVSASIERCD